MTCMITMRWTATKNGNIVKRNPQEIVRRKVDIEEAHSAKYQKELKNQIINYVYEDVLAYIPGAEGSNVDIEITDIVPYYR